MISAFQTLYKVLSSVGIKSLLPRNINQDSQECFFGAIRNVGSANPNCNAFTSAYKTLILNNLVSSHSPGSNCEEDFTEGSLASFKNLFLSAQKNTPTSDKIIAADLPVTINQLPDSASYLQGQTHSYMAGFIIRKLNREFFKNCKHCLSQICSNRPSKHHQLIAAREYRLSQNSLKYPSLTFQIAIEQILNFIGENMSKICHHENIYVSLTNTISSLYNFNNILHCQDHAHLFQTKMIGIVVKMMINHYCTEINRILHGKRKILDSEKDPLKKFAHAWYMSHSKQRRVQGKFNLIP